MRCLPAAAPRVVTSRVALGVMRWLFEHERADPAAADYCDNLDRAAGDGLLALGRRVGGAGRSSIRPMSSDWPRPTPNGPSAILVGWGMQRRANGSATVRMLDALGAVSGNLGVAGGGVSFYFKRRGAFDLSFVRGLAVAPRSIPEPLLGPGILEAVGSSGSSGVGHERQSRWRCCPESKTVARALRTRELTVVVDSFMTDTAREAHLVLPTTTMLEDEDLVGAYGHHYLGNVRPVVPPPQGVRTDYEILQGLAPSRRAHGRVFPAMPRNWKRRLLNGVSERGGDARGAGAGARAQPAGAADVLFPEREFPTASGKVNLMHDVDPQPPRATDERPLLLMALATEKAQASQMPSSRQQGAWPRSRCTPMPRPDSARGRRVRVESERWARSRHVWCSTSDSEATWR